jgi:hypothetical protein
MAGRSARVEVAQLAQVTFHICGFRLLLADYCTTPPRERRVVASLWRSATWNRATKQNTNAIILILASKQVRFYCNQFEESKSPPRGGRCLAMRIGQCAIGIGGDACGEPLEMLGPQIFVSMFAPARCGGFTRGRAWGVLPPCQSHSGRPHRDYNLLNVRCAPLSGLKSDISRGPRSAKSGLMHRSKRRAR